MVKSIINNPTREDMEEFVTIPTDFYKLQKFVTLKADVMLINGNSLMILSARYLKFVDFKHIPRWTSL